MGFEGKAHLIAKKKEDLGPVRAEVVGRLAEMKTSPNVFDWMSKVFGF
jgi:hypothetical protein